MARGKNGSRTPVPGMTGSINTNQQSFYGVTFCTLKDSTGSINTNQQSF
jgi:hypothetical protein